MFTVGGIMATKIQNQIIQGRKYIGIDISPDYVEIARKRIKAIRTGVPVKEQKQGQRGLFEASK